VEAIDRLVETQIIVLVCLGWRGSAQPSASASEVDALSQIPHLDWATGYTNF